MLTPPSSHTRCFGLRLSGDAVDEVDARGERIVDDTLLILVNAHHEPIPFVLPAHRRGVRWEALLDTRTPDGAIRHPTIRGGEAYDLGGRTLTLFSLHRRRAGQAGRSPQAE